MTPLKVFGATVTTGLLLVAAAPAQAADSSGYGGWGMMGPGYGMHGGGWGMMGPGYGPHHGMGWGQRGWGPHHGYGWGQRGYGPHHGWGRGWGPGRGWAALPSNLTVEQVRHMLEHEVQWSGNDKLEVGKVEKSDDDTITAEIVDDDGEVVRRYEVNVHTGARRRVG